MMSLKRTQISMHRKSQRQPVETMELEALIRTFQQ